MERKINWLENSSQGSLWKTKNIVLTTNDTIYQLLFTEKKNIFKKIEIAYKEIWEILWWEKVLNTRKKKLIMSVVIELMENIIKHWDISENHQATFKFYEENDSLFFETKNHTKTENIWKLEEKTKITDTNDIGEIKKAFKNQIKNGEISEKWWTGCWVITIVKSIKKWYPELNTKDIYQKNAIWLNGSREVHVKVKMPNKDPEFKTFSRETDIKQDDYNY